MGKDFISMEDVEGLPPKDAEAEKKGIPWDADDEVEEKITVFVYGSLMKGFGNSLLLANSKFIGTATTSKRYRMVSFGNYPAVCKCIKPMTDLPSAQVTRRSIYRPVIGEVFEVTLATLARLDALEGNGSFYKREVVPLEGSVSKGWMYILMHPETKASLVAVNSERKYSWRSEVVNQRLQQLKRKHDAKRKESSSPTQTKEEIQT